MINATLILQIIHFFIAYFLIDIIFFRVAIAQLQEEDRQRSVLRDKIESLQHSIDKLQQKKSYHWELFKHAFNEKQPQIVEPELSLTTAQSHVTTKISFTQEDEKYLIDLMVRRISHESIS